jgi:hypothetical protein
MKKSFFGSYLNLLLFITVTVLVLSVVFTMITGISPLEALNLRPFAATVLFSGFVLSFIVLPIVIGRMRERS